MNFVILTGRLGRDPELKTGANGVEYSKFSVAVDRPKTKDKEKETDWIDCAAFGKTAVFIDKYFKKGDGIEIQGELRTSTYDDKETGKKRKSSEVIINRIDFPKGKGNGSSESSGSSAPVSGFEQIDPDDLPF